MHVDCVLETKAVRTVLKQLQVALPAEQSRTCARKKWRQFYQHKLAVAKPGNVHHVAAVLAVDKCVHTLPPLGDKNEPSVSNKNNALYGGEMLG